MKPNKPTPLWLHEVAQQPGVCVGEQTRLLGHAAAAGLAVPFGFMLTGDLFTYHLESTKLGLALTKTFNDVKPDNARQLAKAAKTAHGLLTKTPFTNPVQKMIIAAWQQFTDYLPSKATTYIVTPEFVTESTPHAIALQPFHIANPAALEKGIYATYASLFAAKNLHLWLGHDVPLKELAVSFLIQPVLDTRTSGTATVVDSDVVINAVYGEITPLLTGRLTSDRYTVDANHLVNLSQDINKQTWKLVTHGRTGKHVSVPRLDQSAAKLTPADLEKISRLCIDVQKTCQLPTINWVIDATGQAWVIGVIGRTSNVADQASNTSTSAQPLLTGQPASPGHVTGPVRIIHKAADLAKIMPGDIAILEVGHGVKLNKILSAGGVILETGKQNGKLIETLQEQGIPTIVGASQASHRLQEGLLVTLDGYCGTVHRGAVPTNVNSNCHHCDNGHSYDAAGPVITGTKVYATINSYHEVADAGSTAADGLAVLSSHHIHQAIGLHPKQALQGLGAKHYTEEMIRLLSEAASSIASRPIIYSLSDATADEHNNLRPHTDSPKENNPMLGYRGAVRHLREPEVITLELEALRRFQASGRATSLAISLPYVRTFAEFIGLQQLILGSGIELGHKAKIWLSCQVPATTWLLEKFITEGQIDGVIIDLHQFMQHLLGADMANEELFDEYDLHDEAVITALHHITDTCRTHGLPVTVHNIGEATPELVDALISLGVTGIATSADEVVAVRHLVAATEQRILVNHAVNELHEQSHTNEN